ncbi:MAG: hypothetical protein DI527_00700 [Chelatococcus sp.]|nr:MAG: hypothetical protein DI527_00700 [Chelatococcus sp.]
MATREEIIAQIADLREVRASGIKRTKRDSREVEYRTDADLARAITALEGQLTEIDNGRRRRRVFTTSTSKGL